MTDEPKDPFANFPGGNPFGPNGPFGPGGPFAGGGDPFRQMDEWMKSMGIDPNDFHRIFQDMQRGLQDAMRNMGDDPSKGFMAGFNVRMGPDGKPHISSFGNKPKVNVGGPGPAIEADNREPLTDVIEDPTSVAITMELPGVEKKDVDIRMTAERLEVNVETDTRKYNKSVRLPAKVDPSTTKATYNNGVLDVTVQKLKADDDAVRISLD